LFQTLGIRNHLELDDPAARDLKHKHSRQPSTGRKYKARCAVYQRGLHRTYGPRESDSSFGPIGGATNFCRRTRTTRVIDANQYIRAR
jgi:hypothetical protein